VVNKDEYNNRFLVPICCMKIFRRKIFSDTCISEANHILAYTCFRYGHLYQAARDEYGSLDD